MMAAHLGVHDPQTAVRAASDEDRLAVSGTAGNATGILVLDLDRLER